jgi:acyl-CoA synthetase (AMP-forming)/AMP-acid ligase II
MQKLNFKVTHAYGLTEVYGPAVVCAWHQEWDELSLADQAGMKARQGVRYPMLEELVVMDPNTMKPVPSDGKTIGEIMFRGNIVMKGYLKNPRASEEAFAGGYFHSGDLAQAVISTVVISRFVMKMVTSRSWIVPRTSSFPGEKIFPASKLKVRCIVTPLFWKPLLPVYPTKNGAKRLARSLPCAMMRAK